MDTPLETPTIINKKERLSSLKERLEKYKLKDKLVVSTIQLDPYRPCPVNEPELDTKRSRDRNYASRKKKVGRGTRSNSYRNRETSSYFGIAKSFCSETSSTT